MLQLAAATCGVLLGTMLLGACGSDASAPAVAESEPGPSAVRGHERPSPTSVSARPSTGAAAGLSGKSSFPPRSAPARVRLWHCGVTLEGYPEGMWEMREAPFDATNAPASFTGHGTASVPRTDRLVYVDAGGQRLVFLPGRQVPPVHCD